MAESANMTKTERVVAFIRKAKQAACVQMMWGGGSRMSSAERAEQDKLMAREDMDNLVRRAREEIDQLNRDRAAAKSRIVSMRQRGVDKIKIIPHVQALKRLEVRISHKNKLLQNIEASADTASDAELVIETAKAQKSMLGIQKRTLAQAFNGTDIDELVEDIQEHHDDVRDISQTLADMHLGGLGAAGSDEITEDDFDEWMAENVDGELQTAPAETAQHSGSSSGDAEAGSYASMGMVSTASAVPNMPKVPMDRVPSGASASHSVTTARPRKAKAVQMTL